MDGLASVAGVMEEFQAQSFGGSLSGGQFEVAEVSKRSLGTGGML